MWTDGILKNELFENDGCDFFDRVLLKHKMTGDFRVSKFLRRCVDGKQMIHFYSETSVFKFFQSDVNGKHFMRFQSVRLRFQISPADSAGGALISDRDTK